jgi:hypothetical protein
LSVSAKIRRFAGKLSAATLGAPDQASGATAVSSDANLASKTLDSIDPKQAPKPDRPWRIVAGPEISPSALHCAAIGAKEAVETINRTNARHWREANAKAFSIKRHDPPVNIAGGYKFPGAPVIDLAPIPRSSRPVNDTVSNDHSLDIPEFLCRMCAAAPRGVR